jgi:hypothetical protein
VAVLDAVQHGGRLPVTAGLGRLAERVVRVAETRQRFHLHVGMAEFAGERQRRPVVRHVGYYTRLEQGASGSASGSVIDALAGALQLDPAEHEPLWNLVAPQRPTRPRSRRSGLRPSVRTLLDAVAATPAIVIDHRADVLAWNRLGHALLAGTSTSAPRTGGSDRASHGCCSWTRTIGRCTTTGTTRRWSPSPRCDRPGRTHSGADAAHGRRTAEDRPRMSPDEIAAPVDQLGDILAVLARADPADKAEVYRQLGLHLTWHHETRTAHAEIDPLRRWKRIVSEAGHEPFATERQRSRPT